MLFILYVVILYTTNKKYHPTWLHTSLDNVCHRWATIHFLCKVASDDISCWVLDLRECLIQYYWMSVYGLDDGAITWAWSSDSIIEWEKIRYKPKLELEIQIMNEINLHYFQLNRSILYCFPFIYTRISGQIYSHFSVRECF